MRENRGLSLVELLITIAILSIVLAAATSFMITGSRSFAKGNADSELQKEAELTVNQIEDMIIDVNGGMSVSDDGNKLELVMYHGEIVGAATVYTKESVTWNKSGDKMYYGKYNVSYDESIDDYTVNSTEYDNQLLTENVAGFGVDIDTVDETALDGTVKTFVRSVQIRVGYENSNGRVDYATSPIITLRNRMMLSGNPAEIFEDFQAPSDTMRLWYEGTETLGTVPIIDYYSEVQRGAAYNIYARLNRGLDDSGTEIQGGDVSHLVNWEIETTNTMSTIDSGGILRVGETEPNDYLTITAKYKNNPSKKASGIVKVVGGSGKSFKAITITTTSLEPFNPKYGSYPTFSEEGNWTEEEKNAITYKWTVSEPERVESFADTNKDLTLNVKKEAANYGKILTIRLTAYSPTTNETRWDEVKYLIDRDPTDGGDSFMKRGMLEHGEIQFWFDTDFGYDVDVVKWEYYFCNEEGQRLSGYDDLLVYIHANLQPDSNHHFYYTFAYDEELPPDQPYYVKVDAYMKDPRTGTEWTHERIFYIPKVELYDMYQATYWGGANFEFYYGLIGYYDLALANNDVCGYEVVEFEQDTPPGVTLTASIGNTQAKGVNTIWVQGVISDGINDGWLPSDRKPISMKIKVYLKKCPSIYTYVNINFT